MSVVLHQFRPAFGLLNASPFCMKVEVYLRMTGIPYRTVERSPLKAPKGKLPYIDDDGRVVADSAFIIDYINETYDTSLDGHLDARQQARAHAVRRLAEESLYWPMLYSRFVDEEGWRHTRHAFFDQLPMPLSAIVPMVVRRSMARTLHAQGTGRHAREEVYRLGAQDIDALAGLLGEGPFFMGQRPASVDATGYAFLANVLASPADSPLKAAATGHPNLVSYCELMRNLVLRADAP